MPFTNPLIAGLTLIRTAIRSPNYVNNVSGWSINKDGSAEFNDVVIRGTVVAGGGAVTLSSTGIRVVGAGNEYFISTTGGFAARKFPDTGQIFQITPETLFFRPETPSPLGNTFDYGFIDTLRVTFSGGTIETPTIRFESPNIATKAAARIDLRGQKSSSAFDDSAVVTQSGDFRVEATNRTDIVTPTLTLDATTTFVKRLVDSDSLMDFSAVQLFNQNINVNVGDTSVVLGSTAYPVPFPVGATIFGFANITSGSGASSLWYPRFLPVSNTNFNLIVNRPAAATAATTLTLHIAAFVL